MMNKARKKGIPKHRIIPWIYKQLDGRITVINIKSFGTSKPCTHCTAVLAKFKLNVTYMDHGEFITKRSDEITDTKLTRSAKRRYNKF